MSAWILLACAIALEVAGTFFLKLSNGFHDARWGMISIGCYSLCFWFLAPAMKVLPVGIVYAIWAGIGIVAATIIGLFVFNDRLGALQLAFITLILVGAVGLNLTTAR